MSLVFKILQSQQRCGRCKLMMGSYLPERCMVLRITLQITTNTALFERSEFLIDTSQKKSLRVCTCARVHVSNNLGFSVRISYQLGSQDTYM